jgi:hypothetical protein
MLKSHKKMFLPLLEITICFVLVLYSHFKSRFSSFQIQNEDSRQNQTTKFCELTSKVISVRRPENGGHNLLTEENPRFIVVVLNAWPVVDVEK